MGGKVAVRRVPLSPPVAVARLPAPLAAEARPLAEGPARRDVGAAAVCVVEPDKVLRVEGLPLAERAAVAWPIPDFAVSDLVAAARAEPNFIEPDLAVLDLTVPALSPADLAVVDLAFADLAVPALLIPALLIPALLIPALPISALAVRDERGADFAVPGLVIANFVTPDLATPDLVNPGLVNPDLVNPDLAVSDLPAAVLLVGVLSTAVLLVEVLPIPDLAIPDLPIPDLAIPDLAVVAFDLTDRAGSLAAVVWRDVFVDVGRVLRGTARLDPLRAVATRAAGLAANPRRVGAAADFATVAPRVAAVFLAVFGPAFAVALPGALAGLRLLFGGTFAVAFAAAFRPIAPRVPAARPVEPRRVGVRIASGCAAGSLPRGVVSSFIREAPCCWSFLAMGRSVAAINRGAVAICLKDRGLVLKGRSRSADGHVGQPRRWRSASSLAAPSSPRHVSPRSVSPSSSYGTFVSQSAPTTSTLTRVSNPSNRAEPIGSQASLSSLSAFARCRVNRKQTRQHVRTTKMSVRLQILDRVSRPRVRTASSRMLTNLEALQRKPHYPGVRRDRRSQLWTSSTRELMLLPRPPPHHQNRRFVGRSDAQRQPHCRPCPGPCHRC